MRTTRPSLARASRPVAVLAASVAVVSTIATSGLASAAPTAGSAPAAPIAKPGPSGASITLASQVSFDGDQRAYSLASDRSGTTYVGWISAAANASTPRQVHLCTLPLHATACRGGVQTTDLTDASSSAGLRLLVTPGGAVTIVWYHTDAGGGEIAEATSQAGGPLSAEQDVASAPANGYLLDAELGPGNAVWTVMAPSTESPLYVREGVSNPPTTVTPPYNVGFAQLAFAGKTPILAITENALITHPAAYAYQTGGSWTRFKNVPGTWTAGTNVTLTRTSSGVRLITGVGNADYSPVVARWNGHGFKRRTLTGDSCGAVSHDTVADASGRMADVTQGCGKISVSNLADTTHASTVRFAPGATTAGGAPQIATLPRGYAWVAWSTQYNPAVPEDGDRLRVVQVLLPGLHHKVTKRGAHGSVTVTGPASCQPADSISVGVKGHPKHGWKVASHRLMLGSKRVRSSINGASLKPGKTYSLKGSVTFARSGSHTTVKATVRFRSCPKP